MPIHIYIYIYMYTHISALRLLQEERGDPQVRVLHSPQRPIYIYIYIHII